MIDLLLGKMHALTLTLSLTLTLTLSLTLTLAPTLTLTLTLSLTTLLLGKLHVDVRDIAYCLLFGGAYVFWHQFVRYHRTRTLLYFFLNWQVASPHVSPYLHPCSTSSSTGSPPMRSRAS